MGRQKLRKKERKKEMILKERKKDSKRLIKKN